MDDPVLCNALCHLLTCDVYCCDICCRVPCVIATDPYCSRCLFAVANRLTHFEY